MLTFESLLEQAKLRGMPANKMRGVLREYLQILILNEIYKSRPGRTLFFTGGTYLRLVHGLKRFSEDLDFYSNLISQKQFELLMKSVSLELSRVGIKSTVKFSHWDNMLVCALAFPEIESKYGIISQYSKVSGIVIKAEVNKPKWKVRSESQAISGMGCFFPCLCTVISILFADKIDALLKKNRARHIYDIIFMLSGKYPIDNNLLKLYGLGQKPLDVIKERISQFSKAELERHAENLRPFLFDEKESALIASAKSFIPLLTEKYTS
ncbi:MAG: nucleotidyl transferase AbiEii/AbiGii toxin family protein [Candidatus Omnitrophica bacterium]|nr:nucleotidyl transferase AbiEii/AbiGii toxin family protein [Candidatus Omnitrophota bacterium]